MVLQGATNTYKISYNAVNNKENQIIYQEARILQLV